MAKTEDDKREMMIYKILHRIYSNTNPNNTRVLRKGIQFLLY